jgi:anaerobic selenocysteine-containing dehydrogenase
MSAPDDRDPDPAAEPGASRRRFLKRAGALVAAAPVAMALQATVEAAPARKKSRATARPAAPAASADPFAASRPDLSITRTAEERATLERQWKGLVDLVKVIRDAPLDPATEPVTIFAALPRTRARDREG